MHRWVNLRFVLLETRQTVGKEGWKIRRFFLFGHGSTNYRYNTLSFSSSSPFWGDVHSFPQLGPSLFSPLYELFDPLRFLEFPLSTYPSSLFSFNLHAANAPRISSRPREAPSVLASFNLVSAPLSSGFGGDAFRRH